MIIKVMVIRYRGTSPKLGTSQGECPYPCAQVSFFGGGGDGEVVSLFSLRLRMKFSSLKSSTSCSSFNTFLHNASLLCCRKWDGINWILDLFTVFGRLNFLNSTCISPG